MPESPVSYRQALDWLHGLGRFGIKPGLERVAALLERLGNPQESLNFVHIAGTNGKGSTAAMTAAALEAGGYRVGLYTSPYLESFTNRISVNGLDIQPQELAGLAGELRLLVEEIAADPSLGQPTEFEVITALALTFFARRRPDLVVLETGLGGRLDATNVVLPLVTIITNISLDHTEILGDTIEAIAREKAGIIKAGVPLVTASADPRALELFAGFCRQRQAPAYRVLGPDEAGTGAAGQLQGPWQGCSSFGGRTAAPDGQRFSYRGLKRQLDGLFIPLRGAYQPANAAAALTALELLAERGFPVDEGALRRALAGVRWPGRLELLRRRPLLVIDGAHNPDSMAQLAGSLGEYFDYRRLILVLGVMSDKDRRAMLEPLLPLASLVVLTAPALERAARPEQLAATVSELYSGPLLLEPSVPRAVEAALSRCSPEDMVLVTGSLYTVSEARRGQIYT